jgi:hypothetical protein
VVDEAAMLVDGAAALVEGATALVEGATPVVAAGALLGALAVFFELEQPARAIAVTTASVKTVLLRAINLRFLRSATTRWANQRLKPNVMQVFCAESLTSERPKCAPVCNFCVTAAHRPISPDRTTVGDNACMSRWRVSAR